MTDDRADQADRTLSRRRFLGGIGAGAAGTAGALALPAAQAGATAPSGLGGMAAGATAAPATFSRIFNLPAFADPDSDQVRAAMVEIGRPGGLLDAGDALERGPVELLTDPSLSAGNRNNEFHTAGTTFFGQFLDHDMTFDVASPLGRPVPPEASPNGRTPALDLDSVYGGGPVSSPMLYDPNDPVLFRVEDGGLFEDLPRDANGTAIIGDPRNDENLMVSGIHAAMLLFHNRVVERLRSQGVPAGSVFDEARRLVTWHYQWVIVHEFLEQIIGFALVTEILTRGRRFYRPAPGQQRMPVEFQGAAYRFGHSMVRPSYRANLEGDNGAAFFGFIFDPAAEGQADPLDLRGGARAPRRFIGWETFFDFRDGEIKRNKRIDTNLSTPLFRLPLGAIPGGQAPTSLAQRNLLRHMTWSLPSGQQVATAMREPSLDPGQLQELAGFGLGLERSTPLWYYVLKEAELVRDGVQLGPVGARIVGEVMIGLMQLDPNAYLNVDPSWTPTLPRRNADDFDMVDLLTNAGVDPASRRG